MKTEEEAQKELSVVVLRYRQNPPVKIKSRLDHARRAKVPLWAIDYVRDRVGRKPTRKQADRIVAVLDLKGKFKIYVYRNLVFKIFGRRSKKRRSVSSLRE